jgi:hypothetical protein
VPQGNPIRLVDFFGVAAIQSVFMLALVWVEADMNLGWHDVLFAVSAGIVLTSGLLIIIHRHRAAGKTSIRIPSRFLPRVLFNWCCFVFIFAIPLIDLYFLHAANIRHVAVEALWRSLWMALGFAIVNSWSSSSDMSSSRVKLDLDLKSEEKQ